MTRVYLAGPDVFLPEAVAWMERKKAICASCRLVGVSPFDDLPNAPRNGKTPRNGAGSRCATRRISGAQFRPSHDRIHVDDRPAKSQRPDPPGGQSRPVVGHRTFDVKKGGKAHAMPPQY